MITSLKIASFLFHILRIFFLRSPSKDKEEMQPKGFIHIGNIFLTSCESSAQQHGMKINPDAFKSRQA